ncbi:ABC transporter ATP-binding protein [Pseudogracilibacillus auburnensis]|uniref:ABC transporter ATP-binding protein n=1 Tax=Pseudogracilibacillus auburnensis TaxID=1494959 RepID=UPI0027DA031B|nr:ABC transporter ATP-binding protein [Pseudogracilibacillus auburnensis]
MRLKFPGESSLVFKDLSFHALKGEKVLLLGPSGCGKSTLLQVLSGIVPHSIEVPLKYDSIQLPDSWGFVFQDPDTQFCMPFVDEELAFVLENLNVAREKMDGLIKDALALVGLEKLEPHTQIQDLSQGMKQRLALASVLLLQPEVLFLDEPSALLDPEGTVQIWDSVKQVAEDKTVIIVEHNIDYIADWVDRVVLFNHTGEIIADGKPGIIFEKHHDELIQYGIWYPNVWKDYLHSSDFKLIESSRMQEVFEKNPIVKVRDFKGFRGKSEKLVVEEAEIDSGSWIAIVGDNGAGKSTLLLSLMQLLRTSGEYVVNGERVDVEKKKRTPPAGLSLVFQNPELQFVTNSVFDELAFSYKMAGLSDSEIRREVIKLLDLFQIHVEEGRHPFQLSMGQKRRLSVATAFAQGTDVLLLDEPTFGQDARNTFVMLEQLERLRKNGTTIVMVTHDMMIAKHFATEIWTINQGKLFDIEFLQEKKRKENAYARMVHTP